MREKLHGPRWCRLSSPLQQPIPALPSPNPACLREQYAYLVCQAHICTYIIKSVPETPPTTPPEKSPTRPGSCHGDNVRACIFWKMLCSNRNLRRWPSRGSKGTCRLEMPVCSYSNWPCFPPPSNARNFVTAASGDPVRVPSSLHRCFPSAVPVDFSEWWRPGTLYEYASTGVRQILDTRFPGLSPVLSEKVTYYVE